ncbi:hypothetical protein EXN51_27495 [Agrobacterium fabrum]|uniref:Uncharacterized protein n=1 Tax=Agrobacterium fabrum (strain C58 / ATCC 33970) TaxID=176299 RepID=Q8UJZ8_AGRFC|nr:hypothetical protein Atu5326 [Agrobacterium fabrum str. C58]TRB21132.1 hypothetical protein EXN51_27495 [Agrobacterium fabrum]
MASRDGVSGEISSTGKVGFQLAHSNEVSATAQTVRDLPLHLQASSSAGGAGRSPAPLTSNMACIVFG